MPFECESLNDADGVGRCASNTDEPSDLSDEDIAAVFEKSVGVVDDTGIDRFR